MDVLKSDFCELASGFEGVKWLPIKAIVFLLWWLHLFQHKEVIDCGFHKFLCLWQFILLFWRNKNTVQVNWNLTSANSSRICTIWTISFCNSNKWYWRNYLEISSNTISQFSISSIFRSGCEFDSVVRVCLWRIAAAKLFSDRR